MPVFHVPNQARIITMELAKLKLKIKLTNLQQGQ